MPPRKGKSDDGEYRKLKKALSEGNPGRLYFFYGEETYLRDYYFRRLKELLLQGGMAEFNFHELRARDMSPRVLEEAVDCLPMMGERTLVVVSDFDLFRAPAEDRNAYAEIFAQLPDYCCLVFFYDLIEFRVDGKMRKLASAVRTCGSAVEFACQSQSDLTAWVIRRFRSLEKDIDSRTALDLIFYCGDLMTNLVGEIEKIAAYANHRKITKEDILAVATPKVDTMVYYMTDAIGERNFDRACQVLGELIQMRENPVGLLIILSQTLRQLYAARLVLEARRGQKYLEEVWNIRSFIAAKLMTSARRLSLPWCRRAVVRCGEMDSILKSRPEKEQAEVLTGFLLELAQMPI